MPPSTAAAPTRPPSTAIDHPALPVRGSTPSTRPCVVSSTRRLPRVAGMAAQAKPAPPPGSVRHQRRTTSRHDRLSAAACAPATTRRRLVVREGELLDAARHGLDHSSSNLTSGFRAELRLRPSFHAVRSASTPPPRSSYGGRHRHVAGNHRPFVSGEPGSQAVRPWSTVRPKRARQCQTCLIDCGGCAPARAASPTTLGVRASPSERARSTL